MIHVIALIGLEVIVAKKQYIYIESRAGNQRIERAIPDFMSKFGMDKDQATAVAIRLESLGRLFSNGAPVNKPKADRGLPLPTPTAALLTVWANMKKDRTPTRTQVYEAGDGEVYDNPYSARSSMSKTTRSNRLRQRVTRR